MSSSPTARPEGSTELSTTLDEFLGGRVAVEQPVLGHRSGSDAVWLQAAVRPGARDAVLDAGAGVGVAGLCLAARFPVIDVTAIEIDASLCELAAANAARNRMSDRYRIVSVDLTARASTLAKAGLSRESYRQVMANPPYYREGTVRSGAARRRAHVMGAGNLESWVKFLVTMTAAKGVITLIHMPQALPELLGLLEPRLGDITIYPLYPRAGLPATRVIIQGRKGSKAPLKLLHGLVLHEEDGRYSPKAEAVLRGGEGLDLV